MSLSTECQLGLLTENIHLYFKGQTYTGLQKIYSGPNYIDNKEPLKQKLTVTTQKSCAAKSFFVFSPPLYNR